MIKQALKYYSILEIPLLNYETFERYRYLTIFNNFIYIYHIVKYQTKKRPKGLFGYIKFY